MALAHVLTDKELTSFSLVGVYHHRNLHPAGTHHAVCICNRICIAKQSPAAPGLVCQGQCTLLIAGDECHVWSLPASTCTWSAAQRCCSASQRLQPDVPVVHDDTCSNNAGSLLLQQQDAQCGCGIIMQGVLTAG
jgi:hypothetical protein